MDQTALNVYTAERLKAGVMPEIIKQNLIAVGWSEEEAGGAVVAGLVATGVPVPPSGARSGRGGLSSTLEVVLNFFSFILLVMIASAVGILFYQVINYFFPDPLAVVNGGGDVATGSIHYAMAALLISFPIYLLALRIWFRRFREDEEKVESKLTKWLTYLVLLATAITMVGDLVTALFYFLQGEITARFFLKALTVFVIAGIIFAFYFLERRKVQYHKDVALRVFRAFGWAVGGIIAVAVVLGFIVGGSPSTERNRGFDTQRTNDLRSLAGCIANYAQNQKALPGTLGDLSKSTQYSYCGGGTQDPETGMPYAYRIITPSMTNGTVREGEFELCASFALDAEGKQLNVNSYSYPNDKWSKHTLGRSCNTETVTFENSAMVPEAPLSPKGALPVPPVYVK